MTPDARPLPERPQGAGVLLHTEVHRVPLGAHHGRRLTARVRHRTLRIALGRRWSGSLTFGQRRAVAIEVERETYEGSTPEGGPPRYDEVAIPTAPDPWVRSARRILALALAGWLLSRAVRRARRRPGRVRTGDDA